MSHSSFFVINEWKLCVVCVCMSRARAHVSLGGRGELRINYFLTKVDNAGVRIGGCKARGLSVSFVEPSPIRQKASRAVVHNRSLSAGVLLKDLLRKASLFCTGGRLRSVSCF